MYNPKTDAYRLDLPNSSGTMGKISQKLWDKCQKWNVYIAPIQKWMSQLLLKNRKKSFILSEK